MENHHGAEDQSRDQQCSDATGQAAGNEALSPAFVPDRFRVSSTPDPPCGRDGCAEHHRRQHHDDDGG